MKTEKEVRERIDQLILDFVNGGESKSDITTMRSARLAIRELLWVLEHRSKPFQVKSLKK